MSINVELIPAGTRVRSILTDLVYVVLDNFDLEDTARDATVKIALEDYVDNPIAVLVDRMESDFDFIDDEI